MLKALVFDVDGTLAETEEAHRRAFNDTFAAFGLDWAWSRADYARLLRVTGGKERIAAFMEERGQPPDAALIARLHSRKTARYARILEEGGLALRPGVAELVGRARDAGLALAIATTTGRGNVEALCHCCWGRPAAALFDAVAAGDEVSRKKPAPDVYRLALERLGGLAPGEALAVEDSRNGIRSARAAGLEVLVTPSAYTRDEDLSGAEWNLPDLAHGPLPPRLAAALGPVPRPPARIGDGSLCSPKSR